MSAINIRLCSLSELPQGACRGWPDADPAELVLLNWQGSIQAYRNACPHTGAPMEWRRHQFLSVDGRHICCGVHGALFRPQDGRCVQGPCVGSSLRPVPVQIEGNRVLAGSQTVGRPRGLR